jgi:hypothetical protein
MDAQSAVAAVLHELPEGACVDCIALKTKMAPASVHTTIQRLAGLVRVISFQGRCGACSKRKTIMALARSRFLIGDVVTSRAHPDWSGEVVDMARAESGYVSVRWRTPSGMPTHAPVEEPIEGLLLLRTTLGDSGQR